MWAELLDDAVQQLGVDLTEQEQAVFAAMRRDLAAGARLPARHMVMASKALGARAASTGRSALLVRLYDAAAELDPSDSSLPYDAGNHLAKLGRIDEATAAYDRALAIEPTFAWALLNRGRLRYDAGAPDDGIADLLRAARAGCDLDGFHDTVARRIITHRGFVAVIDVCNIELMPVDQRRGFAEALSRAVGDAAAYGGWYLISPVASDEEDAITTLTVLAHLADILRESPLTPLVGGMHMVRSPAGYRSSVLTEAELDEAAWYRPASWAGRDPDRVAHLAQLHHLQAVARDAGSWSAAWAAHYMAGAIALSALLGGRSDWPTPVLRLAVPARRHASALMPNPGAVAAVDTWFTSILDPDQRRPPDTRVDRIGRYALAQFRASAEALLAFIVTRREPPPAKVWLTDDDGRVLTEDGEWATGSMAPNFAYEIWSAAEPVFREWVTTAVILQDPAEHATATTRARQFNALAATELWASLPAAQWRATRERVRAAHAQQLDAAQLRTSIGEGLLVDYYLHEIVEDTIVRLSIDRGSATAVEVPVDTLAGDLQLLLATHRPGQIPADGLSGRADQVLLGDLALAGADCLIVVPFGYLRNLPFHALATVRSAVERGGLTRIAYLPSTAFVHPDPPPPAHPGRCLFVGFDPSGDIDIDGDLDIVRRAVGDVTVLRGPDATVEAVLSALPEHDLAHFACHGDLDTAIQAGYVQLADNRLYPWHLLAGIVTPPTVVLNACLTGTTSVFEPTSDEAFGLHTAFLAAGTRRVIGGLWEINEWSAREFAHAFYGHWTSGGGDPATAVVHAQQTLRAQTADPFLWAPHALFGDWR